MFNATLKFLVLFVLTFLSLNYVMNFFMRLINERSDMSVLVGFVGLISTVVGAVILFRLIGLEFFKAIKKHYPSTE
jgi:hypothetical protein